MFFVCKRFYLESEKKLKPSLTQQQRLRDFVDQLIEELDKQ